MDDPCRQCAHSVELHLAHLASVNERKLNELFFLVSDVEAVAIVLQRCEDSFTHKVHSSILQLLRKCLSQQQTGVSLESMTGLPPFETPTIDTVSEAMCLFVIQYVFDVLDFSLFH